MSLWMQTQGYKTNCPADKRRDLIQAKRTCEWIPSTGYTLGQGKDGYVVQVCCNNDCKYIVKILKGSKTRHILREVTIQQLYATFGAAPDVVDAWICEGTFDKKGNEIKPVEAFIVMEKADITLEKYIKDLARSGAYTAEDLQQTLDALLQVAWNKLQLGHQRGYIHNDPHSENFMLLLDDHNVPEDIVLVDFGKAIEVGESVAESREPYKELKWTFEKLYNEAKLLIPIVDDEEDDLLEIPYQVYQAPQTAYKKRTTRTYSFSSSEDEEESEDELSTPAFKMGNLMSEFADIPSTPKKFSTPPKTATKASLQTPQKMQKRGGGFVTKLDFAFIDE